VWRSCDVPVKHSALFFLIFSCRWGDLFLKHGTNKKKEEHLLTGAARAGHNKQTRKIREGGERKVNGDVPGLAVHIETSRKFLTEGVRKKNLTPLCKQKKRSSSLRIRRQ
jgi:hypothetical protein